RVSELSRRRAPRLRRIHVAPDVESPVAGSERFLLRVTKHDRLVQTDEEVRDGAHWRVRSLHAYGSSTRSMFGGPLVRRGPPIHVPTYFSRPIRWCNDAWIS